MATRNTKDKTARGLVARMREYRLANGLTQTEIAERLQVDMNTVSRWERGETLPRGLSIVTLLRFLAVEEAK